MASLGFDHINRNAPVLIRTPKLTRFEPAQYWGGGPPGNSVVLNPPFFFFFLSLLCHTLSREDSLTVTHMSGEVDPGVCGEEEGLGVKGGRTKGLFVWVGGVPSAVFVW